MPPSRRLVLVGTLAAVTLLAVVILFEVAATVFFAITVAYVLYPVSDRLTDRGLSPRLASGLATALGFVAVVLLVAPLVVSLYQRRARLVALLRDLPESFEIGLAGFGYAVDVSTLAGTVQSLLGTVAVRVAREAPVLALKLFLFAFVVYALLLHPTDPRRTLFEVVPGTYHDLLLAVHERVRDTLYAIYVLQAATAVATFVVAAVIFGLLGYRSWFVLAVLAGILQFVPVVGPSILVLGLAGFDLAVGMSNRAVLVTMFGLVLVGFLPDTVVRPRLAARTTQMPASIYFIGFTGGVLSLGAVGFIAGPLVVAVVAELLEQLAAEA